jgi:hypothetical protein
MTDQNSIRMEDKSEKLPFRKIKPPKSNLSELRAIFENSIKITTIAEPLVSYDSDQSAFRVQQFMEEKDFDIIGVRQDGIVIGYAERKKLKEGAIGRYLVEFEQDDILVEKDSLLKAFRLLNGKIALFIECFNGICGIITRGDLLKTPVRMWLFGLISLIEMHMLRIIRREFPNDSWQNAFEIEGTDAARKIYWKMKRNNLAIDVAEYLSFWGKVQVLLKSGILNYQIKHMKEPNKEDSFKKLSDFRNYIAHSNDLINNDWSDLKNIAEEAEEFLSYLESI